MAYNSEVVMNQRFLLTTTGPFLLSLFFFAVPTKADTLLVGTSLTNTSPGPVLCPEASGCNTRLSQFSSPVAFTIDDIKVVIAGPADAGFNTNGNFQVTLLSQLGTIGVPVGSGNVPMTLMDPSGSQGGVFDFTGLSIPLTAGTEYYLEVAGQNLTWNSSSPLLGTLGTIGLQLSCDPTQNDCSNNLSDYDKFNGTYAMQISGDPAGTPEPSSLILFGTGLLSIIAARFRRVVHP
jgi:hypothetical protein